MTAYRFTRLYSLRGGAVTSFIKNGNFVHKKTMSTVDRLVSTLARAADAIVLLSDRVVDLRRQVDIQREQGDRMEKMVQELLDAKEEERKRKRTFDEEEVCRCGVCVIAKQRRVSTRNKKGKI